MTDPWERSTGRTESVMNTSGKLCPRSSVHKAVMETLFPEDLKYYEDRRIGKIEGKAFEEWGDPLDDEEKKRLKEIEIRKVRCAFFPINYSHGFSGRGGKFSFPCSSLYWNTDEFVVLPESMERPCLVGPRNETVDERVDSSRGSSHEQSDRPLWQASDEKSGPFGVSKDDINAGSLGESRDGEEVGPFGESGNDESFNPPADSRDEKVGPLQELADDEQIGPLAGSRNKGGGLRHSSLAAEEREAEERGSPKDMSKLIQVAARSVSLISGMQTSTGGALSSHPSATFATEPQALFASSQPLASTHSTPSRKRLRDSEDNLKEQESHPQPKRMRMEDRIRMDGILGITRTNITTAIPPPSISVVTKIDTQRIQKRARSLDDDSEGNTRKRIRLYEQLGENIDEEEEYVSGGNAETAQHADSPLLFQDTSSHEVQEATVVNEGAGKTERHKQASVEGEDFAAEDEKTSGDETSENVDNVPPAPTQWETAHGINSYCANIPVPKMAVFDVEGVQRPLYLPTSPGLPNRPWTNEEKEDLRAYIQDYRIEDWALLSQSTSRDEKELQDMYLDVVTARNIQAGRSQLAGIPELYPNLTPPPPPPEEPQKLMNFDQTNRIVKQEETERSNGNGPFHMKAENAESEIDDEEFMDEDWMRRHAPSPEPVDDTGLDEETDPKIKQEDCDAEHDVQHANGGEEDDLDIKQEDIDLDWYMRRDLLEQDLELDALNAEVSVA